MGINFNKRDNICNSCYFCYNSDIGTAFVFYRHRRNYYHNRSVCLGYYRRDTRNDCGIKSGKQQSICSRNACMCAVFDRTYRNIVDCKQWNNV